MAKTLIVAEKPSVAKDIVRALASKYGRFNEHDEFFENDNYVVTSAVGHLVEIFIDEDRDPKKNRWNLSKLPLIPETFSLRPVERTKSKLAVVSRLMQRKDVDTLINACDAGREGELIFRLIVQHAGEKKPINKVIQRLWLQSMTQEAILAGMDNLRTDAQMKGMEDAARCRSEADWMVGINGTRILTAFNNLGGGFNLTTMGRVQTPTLTLLVDREYKIQEHIPRTYTEILTTFKCEEGDYLGKWIDTTRKKSDDPELKADRIWDPTRALAIMQEVAGAETKDVTEEAKTQTQASPLLFDLTSLQREANSKFGMSAKNTLSVAQALYEKHKVLTYPRTDSRFLPEDYLETVKSTFGTFSQRGYKDVAPHIQTALQGGYIRPNKKIFDNSKISDHFAIIPTGKVPAMLDEYETKIFDLVLKRFVAVFFPAAEFNVVTRITKVDKHHFKSEGKVLTKPGWLAIYGKEAQSDDKEGQGILTAVKPGETVKEVKTELKESQTRPAARYTEATLLGAMENAGKHMDSDEAKDAMKGKGLGTPATRAQIIEGLLTEAYIVRNSGALQPTAKAFQLVTLLKGLGAMEFTSAELTGGWEYKLSLMEKDQYDRTEFMKGITEVVVGLANKARATSPVALAGDGAILEVMCPSCHSDKGMEGRYRVFRCLNDCAFTVPRYIAGRFLANDEIVQVLKTNRIGPLQGFRSRMGQEFASDVVLAKDEEGKLKVTLAFQEKAPKPESIDLTNRERVATCPCCKGDVYSFEGHYACINQKATTSKEATCKFRVSSPILQQEISVVQLHKLIDDGKTDLLTGFVSSKTNKSFAAKLFWDKKAGRASFEFEPRKEGSQGGKAKKFFRKK